LLLQVLYGTFHLFENLAKRDEKLNVRVSIKELSQ
jgi:hypothetical protein